MVITQNETRSDEDMQEVLRQLLPSEFPAPEVQRQYRQAAFLPLQNKFICDSFESVRLEHSDSIADGFLGVVVKLHHKVRQQCKRLTTKRTE